MMILIPDDFQLMSVWIMLGLFEIIKGFDIIPIEIILHDMVNNLRLWFCQ